MSTFYRTNVRRVKMTRYRELVMCIWFYTSWAGVHMRRAPTTKVEHTVGTRWRIRRTSRY